MRPITSNPLPSSCREEDALDILANDEHRKFLRKAEELRPTHVEMQCIIQSAIHVFHNSTMDHHVETIVKTEAVSLF